MPSGERPGLLGALSRTIFGSHQVDEDSSSQDEEETHLEPEEGAGAIDTDSSRKERSAAADPKGDPSLAHLDDGDEVASLDGGISGKKGGDAARANSRPSLDLTFPAQESEDAAPETTLPKTPEVERKLVASHAVELSPGVSSLATASPAPSSTPYGQGESHPVEVSPGGTSQGSLASSPASSHKDEPTRSWRELNKELDPRSLELAMEESQARYKTADRGASSSGDAEVSPVRSTGSQISPREQAINVFSGTEPVQIPTPSSTVPPIRTKASPGPRIASSPTQEIVDHLLGQVVHGNLTKDSLPASGPSPSPQRGLQKSQEKLGVMPGERSGELQLLSPGQEPVIVAAPPQNVPLPSAPKAPASPKISPFNSAPRSPGPSKVQEAIQGSSALGILRDQEQTQLYVGQAPGKFDVHTPTGQEFQVAAPGSESSAAGRDATALVKEVESAPAAQDRGGSFGSPAAIKPGRRQAGSGGLYLGRDLDKEVSAGESPKSSDTPSRKSNREAEGPFTRSGPPSKAPKMSEAETPGVHPPLSWEDSVAPARATTAVPLTSPPSGVGDKGGRASEEVEAKGMSVAEQRVTSGLPVGNPSGVTPSLTPSTEQVAQAKSLASGKVDPVTGHSTLDAASLGLPQNSTELLTNAAIPAPAQPRGEPVGAYSSSVAVKPTSGTSNDLSALIGQAGRASAGSTTHSTTIQERSPSTAQGSREAQQTNPKPFTAEAPGWLENASTPMGAYTPEASHHLEPSGGHASSLQGPRRQALSQQHRAGQLDQMEDAVPIESVKREATQASAAPAIQTILQQQDPQSAAVHAPGAGGAGIAAPAASALEYASNSKEAREAGPKPFTHGAPGWLEHASTRLGPHNPSPHPGWAPTNASASAQSSHSQNAQLEDAVPLENVKREATQASAAPAIQNILQQQDTQTFPRAPGFESSDAARLALSQGLTGKSEVSQRATAKPFTAQSPGWLEHASTPLGAYDKAASHVPENETRNVTTSGAAAGESGAPEKVFGSDYGRQLSEMEYEGQDTGPTSGSLQATPQSQLDQRFNGAWGDTAAKQQPEALATPTTSSKTGTAALKEQLSGSAGAGSSSAAGIPQATGTGGTDLALPPLSSAPGSGLVVPEGSQVPQASVTDASFSQGQGVASKPHAAGLGRDVELERPREELPSLSTRADSVGSGVSGGLQGAGGGGNTTPRSSTTTPRASHVFPTSVESPSAALFNPQTQAPPLRMPTPVEARHVDTAAENAKRAAAAAGLTGLLPSLDAGSQRLKSGMGLSPTPSPRDEQATRSTQATHPTSSTAFETATIGGGQPGSHLPGSQPTFPGAGGVTQLGNQTRGIDDGPLTAGILPSGTPTTQGYASVPLSAQQGAPTAVHDAPAAPVLATQGPASPFDAPSLPGPAAGTQTVGGPSAAGAAAPPGFASLLSSEAAIQEQKKAARAAQFDSKVQSGLEEVEPEPAPELVTSDAPATPTAAKAEAVNTPFDPPPEAGASSHIQPSAFQKQATAEDGIAPIPGITRGSREASKEIARRDTLETTGSDEFDAYIDKEAASRKKKQERSPEAARPSSNLPLDLQSRGLQGGAGADESLLGQQSARGGEESPTTAAIEHVAESPAFKNSPRVAEIPAQVTEDEKMESPRGQPPVAPLSAIAAAGSSAAAGPPSSSVPRASPATAVREGPVAESEKAAVRPAAPTAVPPASTASTAEPQGGGAAVAQKQAASGSEKAPVNNVAPTGGVQSKGTSEITPDPAGAQKARVPPTSPFADTGATNGSSAQQQKSEKAADPRLAGIKTQKPAKIRQSKGCACFGGGGATKD